MGVMDGGEADGGTTACYGRRRAYRLVEFGVGLPASEAFRAPNDAVALARARAVALGHIVEVWRGSVLVARWGGGDDEPVQSRSARLH